jgi:hypothetical protein
VAFIDPKGLRQIQGFDSPKIRFHQTVKEKIEPPLNDPFISLSLHIVSNTSYKNLRYWKGQEMMEYFNWFYVYFQKKNEQVNRYVVGRKFEQSRLWK